VIKCQGYGDVYKQNIQSIMNHEIQRRIPISTTPPSSIYIHNIIYPNPLTPYYLPTTPRPPKPITDPRQSPPQNNSPLISPSSTLLALSSLRRHTLPSYPSAALTHLQTIAKLPTNRSTRSLSPSLSTRASSSSSACRAASSRAVRGGWR